MLLLLEVIVICLVCGSRWPLVDDRNLIEEGCRSVVSLFPSRRGRGRSRIVYVVKLLYTFQ